MEGEEEKKKQGNRAAHRWLQLKRPRGSRTYYRETGPKKNQKQSEASHREDPRPKDIKKRKSRKESKRTRHSKYIYIYSDLQKMGLSYGGSTYFVLTCWWMDVDVNGGKFE